jgi:uncharacterized protein
MTVAERPLRARHDRLTRPFVVLGELSLRRPPLTLLALAVLSVVMVIGTARVSTDAALENFLRADTIDYQAFERLRARFPSSDLDVYVSADGPDLFGATQLKEMQELKFSLLLSDAVESVVSVFSLREPLAAGRLPAPIIGEELPGTAEAQSTLEARIDQHPMARGRLISAPSAEGRLALFLVALNRDEVARRGLPSVIGELKATVDEVDETGNLRLGVSGIPAMKAEVIESTRRDILVFNGVGILVGAAICGFFFRGPRLVLMANVPAFLALLSSLGLFGWTGIRINPLMNAVMPLVLVVTFNGAMHFLFAMCRILDGGGKKSAAIHVALAEIGPACALTSITTSIALFSLAFSSSPLIQSFGLMAGACILLALVLVIVVMPVLGTFFLKENGPRYLDQGRGSRGVATLDIAAAAISATVTKGAKPIATAGVLLTALFAYAYFQLEPRYRLSDMLPDKGTAAAVADRIEHRMGSLFPLSVLVEWPHSLELDSSAVQSAIEDAHEVMARHPAISKVNSLYDLQRWAESGGLPQKEASARLVETVPPAIRARFVDTGDRSALVSGYVGNLEAKEVIKILDALEPELDVLRARYPDFTMTLTGISSVAATRSTDIISQLSYSMLGAIAVVIGVIGIAFRSVYFAGLSVVPNLFALFATGAWLSLVHGGLNYATIVGLTVAFGLAVDDTIHVLNRFELEKSRSVTTLQATDRALRLIGTVLILTTVVLIAGLSVTQLSAVPPTRQFGLICLSTLVFALLADLLILPSLILVSSKLNLRLSVRSWYDYRIRSGK